VTLYNAKYKGYDCTVREVTDRRGEIVVTARGNVHARYGDFVALAVDEAPRGFRSTRIDRVIRKDDARLELGEEIVPKSQAGKDEKPTLDQIENEE